jgi:hypothetical protein
MKTDQLTASVDLNKSRLLKPEAQTLRVLFLKPKSSAGPDIADSGLDLLAIH